VQWERRESHGLNERAEFVGGRKAAALREMDARLRADPEAWGDPINKFQALRLRLYLQAGTVRIVSFAVHVNGTPVLVQDVRLTPGSPISRAGGYP